MRLKPTALLLACIALAGCSSSKQGYTPAPPKAVTPATVAAGSEATLFPCVEGNTWRYDMDMQQLTQVGAVPQKAEYTMECKKVETLPEGGTRATLELLKGDVLQDRQIWKIDSTGIYQEQAGLETPQKSEPPMPSVIFPLEVDKVVPWAGKNPSAKGPIPMTAEIVNRGPDTVDTVVGTFSAYRIETTQKYKNEKGDEVVTRSVTWYAPKIGIVKHRQEVKVGTTLFQTQALVLKQYTVK